MAGRLADNQMGPRSSATRGLAYKAKEEERRGERGNELLIAPQTEKSFAPSWCPPKKVLV
jgi:hypothetical protein